MWSDETKMEIFDVNATHLVRRRNNAVSQEHQTQFETWGGNIVVWV